MESYDLTLPRLAAPQTWTKGYRMGMPGGGPPPGPPPPPAPPPIVVTVQVTLDRATPAARGQLFGAIQDYANRLARESESQELSNRDPGVVMYPEVTGNSVARAKTVFDRFGNRGRYKPTEVAALMGVPIFSGAAGIMGSYLHSFFQNSVFGGCVFFTVVCLYHLVRRRML